MDLAISGGGKNRVMGDVIGLGIGMAAASAVAPQLGKICSTA